MTPEGKVTAACVRYLESLKKSGEQIHWLKVAGGPRQQTGQPDLDICFRGCTVKIEVKAPGGSPTKLQEHRLGQWRAAGAAAGCVTSVDELRGLLESV